KEPDGAEPGVVLFALVFGGAPFRELHAAGGEVACSLDLVLGVHVCHVHAAVVGHRIGERADHGQRQRHGQQQDAALAGNAHRVVPMRTVATAVVLAAPRSMLRLTLMAGWDASVTGMVSSKLVTVSGSVRT